jgi:hypothetical protein
MKAQFATLPILAGVILAACGGGNGSTSPSPVPCPLAAAQAIPAPPDLLYPMPNATGVPNGNFTLVAGYGTFTPPPAQIVPANGGTTIAGGPWGPAPSPLPSPAATPRSSSETLYGSAIPALAAQTTYNVDVTFGTPPCQTTETAGSFTTQ